MVKSIKIVFTQWLKAGYLLTMVNNTNMILPPTPPSELLNRKVYCSFSVLGLSAWLDVFLMAKDISFSRKQLKCEDVDLKDTLKLSPQNVHAVFKLLPLHLCFLQEIYCSALHSQRKQGNY